MRPVYACAIFCFVATVTLASVAERSLSAGPQLANILSDNVKQTVNEVANGTNDLAERLGTTLSEFHNYEKSHDAFLAAAKYAVKWAMLYKDITSETVPFEEFINGDILKMRDFYFEVAMSYGAIYAALESPDYTFKDNCLCVLVHAGTQEGILYDSHGPELQPMALLANRDFYIDPFIVDNVSSYIQRDKLLSFAILKDVSMNLISQYIESGWMYHGKSLDYWLDHDADIKVSVSMLLQLIQALNTKQWPINNDLQVCNDNIFDDNVRTRLETVIRRLVHAAPSGMVEAMRATTMYEESADYLIAHSLRQIHSLKRKNRRHTTNSLDDAKQSPLDNAKAQDVPQPNGTDEPSPKRQKTIRSHAITVVSSSSDSDSDDYYSDSQSDN